MLLFKFVNQFSFLTKLQVDNLKYVCCVVNVIKEFGAFFERLPETSKLMFKKCGKVLTKNFFSKKFPL